MLRPYSAHSLRIWKISSRESFLTHAPDKTIITDSSPASIRASVEGSLSRLGTDYIDLYYQHRIDPKVEPEVVAGAMADLIAEGKIRAWGISETTEDYLRRAHAVCPVAAVQNRYPMMARWHEALFPALEELNIAFVTFSPLANGFLTGRYDAHTACPEPRHRCSAAAAPPQHHHSAAASTTRL